jgi:malate permease and related proteins
VILIAATILAAGAAGILAERRWGPGAQRASQVILTVMLYALVPFVAFFNLVRLEIDLDVGAGIGLAYIALAVSGLAAWALGSRVLRLGAPATGALICAVIQANTGYLGLPLTAAVLGFHRLGEAVAYDTLVQAPTLLVAGFAVGAAFGTRAGDGARERVAAFFLRNPPLLAVAAALVAPATLSPDFLISVSHGLVLALLPLGFFVVGVTLAAEGERGVVRFPPPFTGAVGVALGLRLVLAPGLLLLLALPLITLPEPYLLLAAMPVGINALVIAHAYGLDLSLTAAAIAWSTAVVVAVGVVATVAL